MKCKNCGKYFNTITFSETFCPYCGTKVSKEDEEKIRYFEYNQESIIVKKIFKYIGIFILVMLAAFFIDLIMG